MRSAGVWRPHPGLLASDSRRLILFATITEFRALGRARKPFGLSDPVRLAGKVGERGERERGGRGRGEATGCGDPMGRK